MAVFETIGSEAQGWSRMRELLHPSGAAPDVDKITRDDKPRILCGHLDGTDKNDCPLSYMSSDVEERERTKCIEASRAAIGKRLRAQYGRVAVGPLPKTIADLMDKLSPNDAEQDEAPEQAAKARR